MAEELLTGQLGRNFSEVTGDDSQRSFSFDPFRFFFD
jgi:hypothetical protein